MVAVFLQLLLPLSISLVEFTGSDVTQSWWWVSWPWLMLLITIVSLYGFIRLRGRSTGE
ncbi:MAG: hypothetical protein L0332_17680 [Chloroflexi bacterium]|nr:hypothetical protein [Chloroflexota bacterium]MCI0578713.1 hypothetical protein [Chloroflexota bacterium]MCI0648650.1 hypothetical protein [Chloroflexota bacterium]MCI0728532.1 hypothetical protein [Chloroflexota bacterium]